LLKYLFRITFNPKKLRTAALRDSWHLHLWSNGMFSNRSRDWNKSFFFLFN